MKANTMKVLSVMGLVGALAVQTLSAADSEQYQSFRKTFLNTPVLDYPATAAVMVTKAPSKEKSAVTIDVVKAAVSANPASASAVVAAISRTNPDQAALAAGIASSSQPINSAIIAKAAATAAPTKAVDIASSVSHEVPALYARVAVSVSQAVPTYSHKILVASVENAPAHVAKSVKADLVASTVTMDSPVAVAGFLTSKTSYMAAPPVVGPALVEPSGNYISKDIITDTQVVPAGYHAYSNP